MKFENIRNLREDSDKLQTELADYLSVKQTTYSKYELGKINIPVDVLIKLADFYDVDIREIIEGERKSENMENEKQTTLKQVAEYATQKRRIKEKKLILVTIASGIVMLISAMLFSKPSQGFLYGIVPEPICNTVTIITAILAYAILFVLALRAFNLTEKIQKRIRRSNNAKKQ